MTHTAPYIIHTMALTQEAIEFEKSLKIACYIPGRDCHLPDYECQIRHNRTRMIEAPRVYFIWDGSSQGSIFDLGMAYVLYKPIQIVRVKHKFWTWTEVLSDKIGNWLR